jgi:hypothetical protein
MKTLVIHPKDASTDFLKKIYEGKDWTIINDQATTRSRVEITKLIKKHGRIIMMGHGHPYGLFMSCINPEIVYLLRQKLCVCIWCNADQFVEKYGLRGFYTGMFISEVSEARFYGIETTQEKIDYSNNLFATEMNKHIDMICVHQLIKESYVGDDPVIQFNNERLYERDDDDTMILESNLAARDLKNEMDDDDDDLDPAGGHGLYSHI